MLGPNLLVQTCKPILIQYGWIFFSLQALLVQKEIALYETQSLTPHRTLLHTETEIYYSSGLLQFITVLFHPDLSFPLLYCAHEPQKP